jgi:hypothetical protein
MSSKLSSRLSSGISSLNINENIKTVNKFNNKFVDILENPFIKYGFLIFIVLRIIFINTMETWYLVLFNYTSVKIVYALLIAYSACFDPVYAIALTTFIIICIQELYSRNAQQAISTQVNVNKPFIASSLPLPSSSSVSSVSSVLLDSTKSKVLTLPTSAQMNPQQVTMDKMPDDAYLVNDANIYNLINKHTLQRIPDKNDTLIAEYDYYEDPAYRTLTSNIEGKNYLGHNKFYVTDNDLVDIQNNQEPGSNQNVAVQAFPKVMNIQGLPNGFDTGLGGSNPQLASINSD